jgi:hypothetical protein
MNLNELDHLLDQVPLVVQGLHPVSLTFLGKPVKVYPTLEELAWVLDTPQVVSPHRALSFDTNAKYISRFLTVTVEHDPFTPALNNVLFERYEMIAASMLNHAQIADRIVAAARNAKTVNAMCNIILLRPSQRNPKVASRIGGSATHILCGPESCETIWPVKSTLCARAVIAP